MKTTIALILLTVLITFSSCQKDPITPAEDFFISFNLDGTPVEIRSLGGGGNTSARIANSTLANYDNTTIYDQATLWFDFDKNVVKEADFLSLVGQTIEIGSCSGVSSNCGIKGTLNYMDTNLDLVSFEIDNSSPQHYIKINTVTENHTEESLKWYVVEGEFNVQFRENGKDVNTIQQATNGKFKMLFPISQ